VPEIRRKFLLKVLDIFLRNPKKFSKRKALELVFFLKFVPRTGGIQF